MIKVGIIGSTGYAGVEIVRLIMQHKEAEVVWFGSRSYVDQDYASVFRNMFQIVDAKCLEEMCIRDSIIPCSSEVTVPVIFVSLYSDTVYGFAFNNW